MANDWTTEELNRGYAENDLYSAIKRLKDMGYDMDYILNEMLAIYKPERLKKINREKRTMDSLANDTFRTNKQNENTIR